MDEHMAGEVEALQIMTEKLQEGQHRAERRRDNIQDTLGVEAIDFQDFARKNFSVDKKSSVLFGIPSALVGGIVAYFNASRINKIIHGSSSSRPASPGTKIGIAAAAAAVTGMIPYIVNSIKRNNINRVVKKYNTYLDGVAEEGRKAQAQAQEIAKLQHAAEQEYDNGSPDKSHAAMVEASQSHNNEASVSGKSR